jgi:O-antigen/teichoic acid export membrane protein
MQGKSIIKSLGLLLFINVLIKPIWILIIDVKVQQVVGMAQFGAYSVILNLSMLLLVILDPGLHTFINTSLARKEISLKKSIHSILPLKLFLAITYIFITYFIFFVGGFDTHLIKILTLLVFNQVLASFILFFRVHLSGMLAFNQDSVSSVLDRVLMIILVGTIFLGILPISISIDLYLLIQTFAYMFALMVTLFFVHQQKIKHKEVERYPWKWDVTYYKKIIKG